MENNELRKKVEGVLREVALRSTDDMIYSEQSEALISLLQQQENKWVSVEERLPENTQEVFFTNINVTSPFTKETMKPSICYGWYRGNGKFGSFIDMRDAWNATHWMPLPEPPSK